MSDLKTNSREPLEKLKYYPAFQALRAKAETHQYQRTLRDRAKGERGMRSDPTFVALSPKWCSGAARCRKKSQSLKQILLPLV